MILVRTNNITYDSVPNIVDAIVGMCTSFNDLFPNTSLVFSSLLPRLDTRWNSKISAVDTALQKHLPGYCKFLLHGSFSEQHYWIDGLHISEEGYKQFSETFDCLFLKNHVRNPSPLMSPFQDDDFSPLN